MRRRDFIKSIGGAAAWPFMARAQQPAMPVVGFLHVAANNAFPLFVTQFREALREAGYIESQNVAIEYRWADGQFDRLPALAADLVRRRVAVIATFGGAASALAAKAATSEFPTVFNVGGDPVKLGLVAGLGRPGDNATGVNLFTDEMAGKRVGLIHDLVPTATVIALLVNPAGPNAETNIGDTEAAARKIGLHIARFYASDEAGIDAAFAAISQTGAGALLVGADVYLNSRRIKSWRSHRVRRFPHFTKNARLPQQAVWQATGQILARCIINRALMSVAFSRVRSPPTCRSFSRPSFILWSISKPRQRWASSFRLVSVPSRTK
jgi:putative ABC transport system substrate-binding protein